METTTPSTSGYWLGYDRWSAEPITRFDTICEAAEAQATGTVERITFLESGLHS